MSAAPKSKTERASVSSKCLTRSVVDVLSKEPTLEAITINRSRQVLSVATLGQTDVPRLTSRLAERLHQTETADKDVQCALLAGGGNCSTCDAPLPSRNSKKSRSGRTAT